MINWWAMSALSVDRSSRCPHEGTFKGLEVIGSRSRAEKIIGCINKPLFLIVIGNTYTSTIPGISIAGPSPEATLYTPTLDAEYLVNGRPITLDVIPVSPEGFPTPAIITRAILGTIGVPAIVIDAGCVYSPRIPHVVLPSRIPGARIDEEQALPGGRARSLYQESKLLGEILSRLGRCFFIGESIPGGTTVAAALLEALGFNGLEKISSSSPNNPRGLKETVVRRALRRINTGLDVFEIVDRVGDPVHISIAGLASGLLSRGKTVILAGGTQMAAVLGIMAKIMLSIPDNLAIATTPWIMNDKSSDLPGLVREISPSTPVIYTRLSFRSSRYSGLRKYEEGYVKEGVGAGGALVIGAVNNLCEDEMLGIIEEEYERIRRTD